MRTLFMAVLGCALMVFFVNASFAEGKAKEGGKRERAGGGKGGQEMAVTGSIQEKLPAEGEKDKEKEGVKRYILTDAEGVMYSLPPNPKNAADEAIDLSQYIGKTVTITGKGRVKTEGDEKKGMFQQIFKLEEAAVAAGEAAGGEKAAPVAGGEEEKKVDEGKAAKEKGAKKGKKKAE